MIHTWTPDTDTPKPDGGVDYHTVKAWFQRCRTMAAAVEAQRQKIDRIREISEKTTPSMTGMPCGSGAGDKIGDSAAEIVDEERRLNHMKCHLNELQREAIRRIYAYPSTSGEYTGGTAYYATLYFASCSGKDKNGNFKLKTYEMIADEMHVDVSTAKRAVRTVLQTAAAHCKDFDYATMMPL